MPKRKGEREKKNVIFHAHQQIKPDKRFETQDKSKGGVAKDSHFLKAFDEKEESSI